MGERGMITIKKTGLLTTIQDLGRYGFQKYGVIVSGAMDSLAHRIANLLVGNEEFLPTLEITVIGPTIQFHGDTVIAICGGDLSPTINGNPVRSWRPVFVKKDSELKFGRCKKGSRVYLAVAGGFSIPTVMKSKSTYLRAGIGGYKGRALKSGDQLLFEKPGTLSMKIITYLSKIDGADFIEEKWSVASAYMSGERRIRIIKGGEFHLFTKESQEGIFNTAFKVSPQSDRMGYRLKGQTLRLEKTEEMLSEAVCFGTIQVPADGDPIILLADRQTTGGYPRIGHVASVDLPLIAQAKPGDHLFFTEISHQEAQRLYLEKEKEIVYIKRGILYKYS